MCNTKIKYLLSALAVIDHLNKFKTGHHNNKKICARNNSIKIRIRIINI